MHQSGSIWPTLLLAALTCSAWGQDVLQVINPADMPMLILGMTSKTLTPGQIYDQASNIVQQKLSQVEGVGDVELNGASLPAVRVDLNPRALFKYGIGLEDVRAALSAANASLYALTSAVCLSMGFIPQLGFVHDAGTLPFIYDVADLYKHETSWPAAFQAIQQDPKDDGTLARQFLKEKVEQVKLLQRMPRDLGKLFDNPTPLV